MRSIMGRETQQCVKFSTTAAGAANFGGVCGSLDTDSKSLCSRYTCSLYAATDLQELEQSWPPFRTVQEYLKLGSWAWHSVMWVNSFLRSVKLASLTHLEQINILTLAKLSFTIKSIEQKANQPVFRAFKAKVWSKHQLCQLLSTKHQDTPTVTPLVYQHNHVTAKHRKGQTKHRNMTAEH